MNKQLKKLGIRLGEQEIADRTFLLDSIVPVDDGNGLATHQLLEEIGIFIVGCYGFQINPLPYLRATFPGYEWKFSEVKGQWSDDVKELVSISDFFWLANNYDWNQWVTARLNGLGTPRKVFGNGFLDEVFASDGEAQELLRDLNVQEFWPSYARGQGFLAD